MVSLLKQLKIKTKKIKRKQKEIQQLVHFPLKICIYQRYKQLITQQQIKRSNSNDSDNPNISEHLALYRYIIPQSEKNESAKQKQGGSQHKRAIASFLFFTMRSTTALTLKMLLEQKSTQRTLEKSCYFIASVFPCSKCRKL